MIELVESRQRELAEICRKYRVKTLELFGSAVGNNWDATTSDLDFLVEFGPLDPGQLFDNFFDLKYALENLFGRNADLVIPRSIRNPYFLADVNRTRRVLYAA
jgi:predicted nucleotidyltransferase